MHESVFYFAAIWMALLLCAGVVEMLRAPSMLARVLALDMVTLILVAFLILLADSRREPYYLDAAVALALLSFAGTLAAARYHARGQIF
jgi:multicomponent Na+:H+ antiporter subunit F